MMRTFIAVLALLAPLFCWADSAKDIKFRFLYQAPETDGEWVFMFDKKDTSGGRIKQSDLPEIKNEAQRMAKLYCKTSARWYDNTVVTGGLLDGTTAIAEYVKTPLAKKRPDKIKVVYFTKSEEVIECETPVKKPCPLGMVCLW